MIREKIDQEIDDNIKKSQKHSVTSKIKKTVKLENFKQHLINKHGLEFEGKTDPQHFFKNYNYYHFSGYRGPFLKGSLGTEVRWQSSFMINSSFEDLIELIRIDEALSTVYFKYMLKLEKKIKARVAYYLGVQFGPLALYNKTIFRNEKTFYSIHRKIIKSINRGGAFVEHHNKKYDGLFPVWVAIETVDLGTVQWIMESIRKKELSTLLRYVFDSDSVDSSWGWESLININDYMNAFKSIITLRNKVCHMQRIYDMSVKTKIEPISVDKLKLVSKSGELYLSDITVFLVNSLSKEDRDMFNSDLKEVLSDIGEASFGNPIVVENVISRIIGRSADIKSWKYFAYNR